MWEGGAWLRSLHLAVVIFQKQITTKVFNMELSGGLIFKSVELQSVRYSGATWKLLDERHRKVKCWALHHSLRAWKRRRKAQCFCQPCTGVSSREGTPWNLPYTVSSILERKSNLQIILTKMFILRFHVFLWPTLNWIFGNMQDLKHRL